MKKLFYILAFLPFALKADYDSLFCIAVNQYNAIPENVSNGDYVHFWLKNVTYLSYDITYSIENNWNNAFAISEITNDSALITINDYTKINGKIVQQDTIINLPIRITDNTFGSYEIDTLVIYVKEASWCTLDTTSLDFPNGKAGRGYFFERGQVFTDIKGDTMNSVIGTAEHPTIIGAYGQGADPVHDGGDYGSHWLWIGDCQNEDHEGRRCEYVYIFNQDIHNFQSYALLVNRTSNNIIFNNNYVHNCDKHSYQASVVVLTQSYDDSIANFPTRLQNNIFDTTGFDCASSCAGPDHVKIGAGPCDVINNIFRCNAQNEGTDNGTTLRAACGHDFYVAHNLFENSEYGTMKQAWYDIQIRCDSSLFLDNIFLNAGWQSAMDINPSDDGEGHTIGGDSNIIRNCRIRTIDGSDYGIYGYRGSTDYTCASKIYIEDCDIAGVGTSIYTTQGDGLTIRRNRLADATTNNIYVDDIGDGMTQNVEISYNITYGAGAEEILFGATVDNVDIYNNTVDGEIDNSNCTHDTTRYCYLETLTGELFVEDTLHIDFHSDDFTNYAGQDYTLVLGADGIDAGSDWGQTQDYLGNSKSGAEWDIGAYEYQQAESGTANTYLDGKLGVKTYKGKTVTFLKP